MLKNSFLIETFTLPFHGQRLCWNRSGFVCQTGYYNDNSDIWPLLYSCPTVPLSRYHDTHAMRRVYTRFTFDYGSVDKLAVL